MRILDVEEARCSVEINASESIKNKILSALVKSGGLLTGHFALHRGRHSTKALRFRGIGRDSDVMESVVEALFEQIPEEIAAALRTAKVLSPETSGFFLGSAVAHRCKIPIAVSQTDMRRLPTQTLLSGTIEPNDRIVLVSDVSGTGTSIAALCDLVAQRGAKLSGILLFGIIDGEALRKYCDDLQVPVHWLVSAEWESYLPGSNCPGCNLNESLIPIVEFV